MNDISTFRFLTPKLFLSISLLLFVIQPSFGQRKKRKEKETTLTYSEYSYSPLKLKIVRHDPVNFKSPLYITLFLSAR